VPSIRGFLRKATEAARDAFNETLTHDGAQARPLGRKPVPITGTRGDA
jgi:hypothetical protein